MDAAICQTLTTEHTIHGSAGSPTTTTIPWNNFYNMVLSNAKLLDSTRSKQTQETNQANSNCNNNNRGNNSGNSTTPSTPTPVVKWTGKNMVMKKGMHFSPEDWKKVTQAQKTQIYAFHKAKKTTAASTTVSVNTTEIQSAPSPAATPTPHTVMTTSTNVRHLLSNITFRDSNSVPNQVIIDGRTYNLSYCDCTYSIHQNLQRPCGSLIDGGANGGLMLLLYLKPSSLLILLLLQTILYRKSLFALLLALYRLNMALSLVFSTNMHTMALVRRSILSPSYVILAPSSTTLLVRSAVKKV
jgi:hypothetical protein